MSIFIKCKRIIDGTGKKPKENGAILVEQDKITAVGKSEDISIPQNAAVVDLSDSTILPGLIDCHTHLMMQFGEDPHEKYPEPELYQMLKCAKNMRVDIRSGLTTIRNPSERSFRAVAVRHAIDTGLIAGPRILTGIRGIRPTHGWGMNAFGFDGIESLRKAIRENISVGADLIKIYVSGEAWKDTQTECYFTKKEIELCVGEAHFVGLPVAAHCHGGVGMKYCLEAGVDTIEHGAMITENDIDLFLKHNNTLVATFNPYMHETVLTPDRSPEYVSGVKKVQENIKNNFPKALNSGIKFTVGTDARHGNYVFELEMLMKLGLSAMEAICAGTRQAAEALGILEETGTLEVGKLADIVATRGNPLEDVSVLRELNFVMKAGKQFDISIL